MRRLALLFAPLLVLPACDTGLGGERPDGEVIVDAGAPRDAPMGTDAPIVTPGCFTETAGSGGGAGGTIDDAVAATGCSTAVVRALSEQLIAEVQCLSPGTMARIDDIDGLTLGASASPWLQAPARDGLAGAVADGGGGLSLNSTLRTLPQQLMLYRWYMRGACGITLAASPGTSPHESGLAIDTSDYTAWRPELEANGWRWHGAGDLVHFDYVGGGTRDLSGLSVLAFQRLWNRNHPEDPIAEDGDYGPQTESRLRMSPVDGFPVGARCDVPSRDPLILDWSLASDAYTFVARANADVTSVTFAVDGRSIGSAPRAADGTYTLVAGACADGAQHVITVQATGGESERAVALLEAEAADAIFVRPRGASTYEIGLERPAPDVVAIEVRADGVLLTDATTMTARSTRNAVRYQFSTLGARSFELRSFDAGGAMLETRTFGFTLE